MHMALIICDNYKITSNLLKNNQYLAKNNENIREIALNPSSDHKMLILPLMGCCVTNLACLVGFTNQISAKTFGSSLLAAGVRDVLKEIPLMKIKTPVANGLRNPSL